MTIGVVVVKFCLIHVKRQVCVGKLKLRWIICDNVKIVVFARFVISLTG